MSTELRQLNEQYIEGLKTGDAAWFERRLADDFVCIESDGLVRDKTSFVRKVAGGPGFTEYVLGPVNVRTYGDVALVQASGTFTRADGATGVSRYVDVYARTNGDANGEWKVISAQVTRATDGA